MSSPHLLLKYTHTHTHTHTRTGFFFHPPFSFSFLSFLMVSFTVFLVSFTFLHFCCLHSCLPCCLNSSLCWSSFLSQLNWDMTTAKHPGIFILSVFPDVAAGAQGWSQNLGVTRDSPSLPQSVTRKVSISIHRALALPSYVHSHCPTQQETEHKERERSWLKKEKQNWGAPSLSSKRFCKPLKPNVESPSHSPHSCLWVSDPQWLAGGSVSAGLFGEIPSLKRNTDLIILLNKLNKVTLLEGASLIAQLVKNPPATQETPVWFLAWEDPLGKG